MQFISRSLPLVLLVLIGAALAQTARVASSSDILFVSQEKMGFHRAIGTPEEEVDVRTWAFCVPMPAMPNTVEALTSVLRFGLAGYHEITAQAAALVTLDGIPVNIPIGIEGHSAGARVISTHGPTYPHLTMEMLSSMGGAFAGLFRTDSVLTNVTLEFTGPDSIFRQVSEDAFVTCDRYLREEKKRYYAFRTRKIAPLPHVLEFMSHDAPRNGHVGALTPVRERAIITQDGSFERFMLNTRPLVSFTSNKLLYLSDKKIARVAVMLRRGIMFDMEPPTLLGKFTTSLTYTTHSEKVDTITVAEVGPYQTREMERHLFAGVGLLTPAEIGLLAALLVMIAMLCIVASILCCMRQRIRSRIVTGTWYADKQAQKAPQADTPAPAAM